MKRVSQTLVLSVFIGCAYSCQNADDTMQAHFLTPQEYTKPGIYWYWMNENVSKEGITKDLESLHSKGVGEVFIGNIYYKKHF